METKQCSVCKVTKKTSEFSPKGNTGRYRSSCKKCQALASKKYRADNVDKCKNYNKSVADRKKLYIEVNREKIKEQRKLHYEVNREKINEKARLRSATNREKIKKQKELYYEANREEIERIKREKAEARRLKHNEKMKNKYNSRPSVVKKSIERDVIRASELENGEKKCWVCSKYKKLSEFYAGDGKYGRIGTCKACNGEEWRAKKRAKRQMDSDLLLDPHIKHVLTNSMGLKVSDIPPEIIELKRISLKIKRALRDSK